jgi:hypothetical protein
MEEAKNHEEILPLEVQGYNRGTLLGECFKLHSFTRQIKALEPWH